jgi:D-threo-aldose 1-dehydrogenase
VCSSHGVALPQAALAFCAAHPAVATIVLGAVTPQEVARNLDLVARPVPAALWRDLKREGLLAEAAPVPEA